MIENYESYPPADKCELLFVKWIQDFSELEFKAAIAAKDFQINSLTEELVVLKSKCESDVNALIAQIADNAVIIEQLKAENAALKLTSV